MLQPAAEEREMLRQEEHLQLVLFYVMMDARKYAEEEGGWQVCNMKKKTLNDSQIR